MIVNSTRFGGGGGGGSNREVMFTLGIRGGNTAALDALGKRIDDLQKRAGNIQIGTGGAAAIGGVGGVGGTSVITTAVTGAATTTRMPTTAASRTAAGSQRRGEGMPIVLTSGDKYQREQDRFWDRVQRAEHASVQKTRAGAAGGRGGRGGAGGGGVFGHQDVTFNRSSVSEGIEGVMQLARAFVYLGAASEENLEKAIRMLAKFEAAAMGVRGVLKVSEPLGKGLGMLGGKAGLAAGASAGWLGAAGLAAGVGIAGAGMAITDQIRYSRTGEIGGYSQGWSNMATRAARFGRDIGWDPRQGGFMGAMSQLSPAAHYLNYSGHYRLADSEDQLGRGLVDRGYNARGEAWIAMQNLEQSRGGLAAAERQYRGQGMLRSSAMDFQSMPRGMQNRLLRRRDSYLDNPEGMKSRKAMSIYGLLGPEAQESFQEDMQRRSQDQGLFSRGFGDLQNGKIPSIKFDEVLLKRELVAKFEIQNTDAVKKIEDAAKEALKLGNEDLERKFNEMIEGLKRDQAESDGRFQQSQNTVGGLRGY